MATRSNPMAVQIALCLSVFLVPFMGSSLNLAMPLIVRDFPMSAFSLTFLVSAYLVAAAMFQMPAARIADMRGRRKIYLLGLGVFSVFSLASGLSWSGASLTAFRFLSGVGSAMVFATNMAILTAVFPKNERGKALGVNTAVVYFSAAAGPFLGGLLAARFGWRSIFFVCTVVAVLSMIVAVFAINDEWTEAKGEAFDTPGTGIYLVAVGGVIFGFSFLPLWAGWALLLVGAVAFVLFAWTEKRVASPMIHLDLFYENRHFRLSSLSAMINYSASFAIGFVMSLYLQYVKGMGTDSAGLALMAQPVTQMLLSPFAGKLSDRVNPSILATSGMGLICVGLIGLSQLGGETPVWGSVIILAVIGVGFALFSSPNMNLIMGSVASKDAGLASATTGTARLLGQSLSIATTSLIVNAYLGRQALTMETSGLFLPAMNMAFWIFAGICLVGVYTSASKLLGADGKNGWQHVSQRLEK